MFDLFFCVDDLRKALFLCLFVLFFACLQKKKHKKHKSKSLTQKTQTKHKPKHKQNTKNINKFMLHLCFVYVLFVFRLCFLCMSKS